MGRSAAVSSKMRKEISIQDLEKQGVKGPVFVTNNSPRGTRGDIMFSAPKVSGTGSDVVKVAKTWIPQDLTDQVTKDQLMSSSEFRKTVHKGFLKLVSPEYAEVVLSSDDAREEAQRIANLASAARQIMRANPVTPDADDEPQTATTRRRKRNQQASDEDRGVGGVTVGDTGFTFFLNSLEGKSETTILNMLKNEGGFTRRELKEVGSRFGDLPRVNKWVQGRLDK